jgi:S-adenosylmethionine hydrolase
MPPLITLTTDFGLRDHYVGAMKGVMLNINPSLLVVDICHAVNSYDLLDGALTIAQAYPFFPGNSIHVVVVDPGVGTDRRPILVEAGKHRFVAPDNGVLSLVYEREEHVRVYHITAEHYFLHPVSATFHGRDIFAPVAAHLSKGVSPASFGEILTDYQRFSIPRPRKVEPNMLQGRVIKVDKFGNLVTNIRPEDAPQIFSQAAAAPFRILIGKGEVRTFRTAFAEGSPGEAFAIVGSMGFLEIATNRGSATQLLEAGKGSEVNCEF